MLCGRKKPLTTSVLDIEDETFMNDSGVASDDILFEGVENIQGLQFSQKQQQPPQVHQQTLLPAHVQQNRMEHITVLMKRAKKGFGFTVTGSQPVKVGRVEDGSPALNAGLRPEDRIIRINGQNVVSLDNEKVAKIVKSCDKQVIMDVHRGTFVIHPDPRMLDFDDTLSESSYTSSSGFGSGSNNPHVNNNNLPYEKMPKVSPWGLYHQLKDNQAKAMCNDSYLDETCSEYSYYTDVTETESCYSCYTCCTTETEGSSGTQSQSPPNKVTRLNPELPTISPAFDKENMAPKLPPKTFNKVGLSNQVPKMAANPPPRSQLSSRPSVNPRLTAAEIPCVSPVAKLSVRYHELSEQEVQRQKSLHKLYSHEVSYLKELQRGIRLFHAPLKHNIISPQQHAILFQNIQQLCALSELLLSNLSQCRVPYSDVNSPTEQYMDNVGSKYSCLLETLCESYELYCSGVCDSIKLLNELQSYKDFNKYIKSIMTSEGVESSSGLSKFIQKPVEHVKITTLLIQEVFKATPTDHVDSEEFQEMIHALRRMTTNFTQEYIRRSRTNLAASSVASKSTRSSSSSSSGSSYASSSVSTSNKSAASSTVDSEVVDIQNRLLFPAGKVKAFQLGHTTRHVIYAGELLQQSEDNQEQWTDVHAILMNDLLLLTKKQTDNFLTVLDTPVLLTDITHCTSGDKHPSEFQITVESKHCDSLGMAPTVYKFRATAMEQKCVWKNLLEQRVACCKNRRELTVSKVAEL